MLAIVGAGITVGVLIHSSADVDVREMEAGILNEKISDCVFEHGFLVEGFLGDDFDFLETCKLSEEIFGEGSVFYFNVKVYDEFDALIKEVKGGDFSFEADCAIQEEVVAEEYPRCFEREENIFYYEGGEIEEGSIEILAVSHQKGGKAFEI